MLIVQVIMQVTVGPTADGFETYGVTGVALISFIVLAVPDILFQTELLDLDICNAYPDDNNFNCFILY